MQIYHQLGHHHKWNIEAFQEDSVGDGFIFAPRNMKREVVEKISSDIRAYSIFDPQFFLPNQQRGQLNTYEFFPDIVADGFDTIEYPNLSAHKSAEKCVEFQLDNNFRYIVIPNRHVIGTPLNYQNIQQSLYVTPFLKACGNLAVSKPVVIQLVLNENMLKDETFYNNLLNWVTGIQEISGVYLIIHREITSKQMMDIDLLIAILTFIDHLKQNELTVILGYLNVEAFLLSIALPDIITIGSYETTRIFNIKNFQNIPYGKINPPNARIYAPKLLQLIDYNYKKVIEEAVGSIVTLFYVNRHTEKMFTTDYKWNFGKPEPYKDYFLNFSNQLRSLTNLDGFARYNVVSQSIKKAMSLYKTIEDKGVVLDRDSSGTHLPAWLTAANQFAAKKGWR